jgi:transposase
MYNYLATLRTPRSDASKAIPLQSQGRKSVTRSLESFAKGIQQDKAAVVAGLTLPWSNGPTEGHVNRLKLIKRSMYGRAKLPLLRARVLHVVEKEPSRAAILAG